MTGCIDSFMGSYYFLSNYYPCPVRYKGLRFLSSEAAYQAQKSASDSVRQMFVGLTPDEAKALGNQVNARSDWDTAKIAVMHDVVREKFWQNSALAILLDNTGDEILKEGNDWGDTFWGVDSTTGEGQNQLGIILMQIRNELRQAK
ncbi:MAG: NADAR family protein [Clostridiales bacterium]|nr:NADAR family protein [Clostridiales bacterium]